MRIWQLFSIALIGLTISCKQKAAEKEVSLLEYGVPLTLRVPEDAQVKHSQLSFEEDITISNGKDFNMQIFISPVTTTDKQKLLQQNIEEIKQHPYFSEIVEQNPEGFIYKMLIDSTPSYGFRIVHVMGDREITFRESLMGTFSREQIDQMYATAKAALKNQ